MRLLPLALFSLLSLTQVYAGAVAGKTHILIDGRQPYWVPLAGGPATPLATAWGLPVGVATDGEHFLVASGTNDHRTIAALYDEGAPEPFQVLTLETESGGHMPEAVWDGTRYVVMWAGPRNEARGAVITREGTVTRFEVPDFHIPRVVASNGTQVILFNERLDVLTSTRTIVLRAALLGIDLAPQKVFTLDTTPAGVQYAHNQPYYRVVAAIPFGSGFYAVASRGDGYGNDQLIGMRVSADGSIMGRTVLDRSSYGVFDVDLIPSGPWLMAIAKWIGLRPVTATFIAPDGSTLGPQKISPPVSIPYYPDPMPSAVRLPDGALVLVQVENGIGTVTPLTDGPRWSPRRRGVRH